MPAVFAESLPMADFSPWRFTLPPFVAAITSAISILEGFATLRRPLRGFFAALPCSPFRRCSHHRRFALSISWAAFRLKLFGLRIFLICSTTPHPISAPIGCVGIGLYAWVAWLTIRKRSK